MSTGLRPSVVPTVNRSSKKRRRLSEAWERRHTDYMIALYERALRRDPRNHLLLLDLARAYADAGRDTEAKGILQRLVALHPTSAALRAKVAELYARLRCARLALEHFHSVLRLDPDYPGKLDIRAAIDALSEELDGVKRTVY